MLLSPRRIPKRFNRRVSPQTKALLNKRQSRQKGYMMERWRRAWARWRRQLQWLRKPLLRALWIALIALIPLAGVMVFFSPALRLNSIGIARSDLRIDIPTVQRALKPLMGERLFFVSSHEIQERLQGAVPDLQSVSISKGYPNRLSVQLTLDPIVARLRIESASAPAAESGTVLSDYLTRSGIYVQYAAAQVPGVESVPELIVVDWAARPNVGTKPFDPRILERLPEAEHALSEQFGQAVQTRTIYVRAQEFHLQLKEFAVWFDLKSELEDQLKLYRIFLQTVPQKDVKEYVDLRLADRIVYR
ncbi:MAG: FtsQ-type POTRA domain-containing protein [Candidatus Peribacteraceae bacterium]|nr:FtsQ-type POTRA domain-containing protein [Candidatus Peribacteraceae bacterium]